MAIFESNCFTEELLSQVPKIQSNGSVQLGSNFIGLSQGKITNAYWNGDGVLVVTDDNNGTHFFTGLQRRFDGHDGKPFDPNGLQKAIKECKTQRAQELLKNDNKAAKKARHIAKGESKSSCGFCCIFKCLFKTLLNLICLGALLNDNDK